MNPNCVYWLVSLPEAVRHVRCSSNSVATLEPKSLAKKPLFIPMMDHLLCYFNFPVNMSGAEKTERAIFLHVLLMALSPFLGAFRILDDATHKAFKFKYVHSVL